MKLIIHTDGASRGNPGDAGIGITIANASGEMLAEIGEYIGVATNNVAEYTALIRALEEGRRIGATEIDVYSDSELLVKQIKGEYRVKNEGLLPLFLQVFRLKKAFQGFTVNHVPREQNKLADRLANLGIDSKTEVPAEVSSQKMEV